MSETPDPPTRKRSRFWLNLGEATAVLAVVIAGLNYWDSHRERGEAARQTSAEQAARTVLVLKGQARNGGGRLGLEPVSAGQVIQSQRYLFPASVLDHPQDVVAASPRIDMAWIAPGLIRQLDARRAKTTGEGLLPVAIVTAYVEDGQKRTDRSLYDVGYAWRPRLFGRQIRLQGLSLDQRGVAGDLQAKVDRQWSAGQPQAGIGSGDGPT